MRARNWLAVQAAAGHRGERAGPRKCRRPAGHQRAAGGAAARAAGAEVPEARGVGRVATAAAREPGWEARAAEEERVGAVGH